MATSTTKRPQSKTGGGSSGASRRSVIITFKPKDKRPNQSQDKLDILSQVVDSEVNFLNPGNMTETHASVPANAKPETIGYDIDEFETPIVMASLTDREIEAVKKNENVAAVEEDGTMETLGSETGSERSKEDGKGLRSKGAEQQQQQASASSVFTPLDQQGAPQTETIPPGVSLIKAPAAWDCSRGKEIKVALLDAGLDNTHPDLSPNYKGGISFIPGEPNPGIAAPPSTHLAGIIAAALNGSGVVGVAPAASLYSVKVVAANGGGSVSTIIAGIQWCIRNKMDVLCLAFGSTTPFPSLEGVCNLAWSRGLLLVAGAGLSGPGADNVAFPARYNSVIAVSSIDDASLIAPFSSRGPKVELCAPGVNVLSTVNGGGFEKMSGPARACAHVCGAAALAWGAHRFADNVTIRRLLASTADELGTPGRDPLYGFGRVNAEKAACERTLPPAIPGLP